MLQIIVATDFSEIANNAIQYACELASFQKAEITILHAYMVSASFHEMPLSVVPIDDVKNSAESKMETIVKDLRVTFPTIVIKGKILYGDIIDSLDGFTSKEVDPWLIIVGNSNTGENSNWLDSKMIQAFRKLKCPVLAVPPDASFKSINRICFTYDNVHKGSELALEQLKDITSLLHAELNIVFAQTDANNKGKEPEIDKRTKALLESVNPKYHIIFTTSLEGMIHDFISEHNIDWLIVMPRQRSFIGSIFHKSHTKAIAHHIHIPLVALHEQ